MNVACKSNFVFVFNFHWYFSFLRLYINDKKYYVKPPVREKVTSEELTRLGDVRALVAQVGKCLAKRMCSQILL